MAFRSENARLSKLDYSVLIAAALARIALAGGDPVALDWLGGDRVRALPAMAGREAFERVLGVLENARPGGELRKDGSAVERALAPLSRHAGRGAIVVLLSDLLDLPDGTLDTFAALATRGKNLFAVRVLDPAEATFPYVGPVRLRSLEGREVVEANAELARGQYLEALEALAQRWDTRLVARGGRLIRAITDDDPVHVVRNILLAAMGHGP
jgi:uncharacterized protein (DUF58 family)